MKKTVSKALVLALCGVLALGGMGGVAHAVNNSAGTGPASVDSAPADSGAKAVPTSSYDPDAEKNVKDETVYVLASADGTVQKIIVSNWVQNALGSDSIDDVTQLATNELFNDAASELEDRNDLDDLDGRLDELTDAMAQLIDGSSQLYDGLCTLLDNSKDLVSGIDQLAAGAAQLKQGADSLSDGAAQLQAGADALSQGLNTLSESNATLNGGAAQVFQSLLSTANSQLAAAGVQAPELTVENYSQVLEGVIASAGDSPAGTQVSALKASLDSYNSFYQGLQSYTAGVAQSAAGAGELNNGVTALKNGADGLSTGAGQLYDGILTMKNSAPALIDGVTRLRDGAMELTDGLKEFDEQGVQKLVDAFDGDLAGLMDRVNALRDVSERYNSFSGISADMDGQVKFIWRTEAVDAQD